MREGVWLGFAIVTLAVPVMGYEPNWESLAEVNESPKWFRDAKFGIRSAPSQVPLLIHEKHTPHSSG